MTHWDPRDTGDDPEDEKPIPGWLWCLGFFLWCCVAVGLLTQCSTAKAETPILTIEPPAFDVVLPDRTVIRACTASYDAPGKTFEFGPCVVVFNDSFEG